MQEAAEKMGFKSVADFLEKRVKPAGNSTGSPTHAIDFMDFDIKKYKKTLEPDNRYPKHFYDKNGKGRPEKYRSLFKSDMNETEVFKGVGGSTDNPLKYITEEYKFLKAENNNTKRYATIHPEIAMGYPGKEKEQFVLKSNMLDMRAEGHLTSPHMSNPLSEPADVQNKVKWAHKDFIDGVTPKGSSTIPSYETLYKIDGMPEKVQLHVPYSRKRRLYYDLGEVDQSKAEALAQKLQQQADYFHGIPVKTVDPRKRPRYVAYGHSDKTR